MSSVRTLIAFILLYMPLSACFAGVLKGVVTDDKGITLPYATIFVQGTTIGVSAGNDGNYQLQLSPGSYKVVCSYIGFKQSVYSVTIQGDGQLLHDFKLADLSMEMKEVVVSASSEDPAYAIMRKTIERRKYHLQQIATFHTGIYFKGIIRSRKLPTKFMGEKIRTSDMDIDTSGKGILYLAEEDADYYTKGNRDRTIIHSVKESGDPNGVGFARFPPVIPFYSNNINLSGKDSRGFVSPVSDNAMNYYKYHLEGQFEENGHTIFKIKVMPKRLYEPAFSGELYIVDQDFAIHSLDLFLTARSNLDLLDTLRLRQVYLPLEKDNWVIKDQVIYYAVKLLGFDITGSGVAVYDNQTVNIDIPDEVFEDKFVSIYDKSANKKDTTYWIRKRPVPLELDENRNYGVMDSIYKKTQSPAYKDSSRIAGNKVKPGGLLLGGVKFASKNGVDHYGVNALLLGMVNFNPYEGLNVAPKLTWEHLLDTGKYLKSAIAGRYGFHNHHFNGIAKVDYVCEDKYWKARTWTVGVQGGQYVFQFNPDNPVIPEFNTVASLFYGENDIRIYERAEATAHVARNYGNGFKWNISGSYQLRKPIDSTGYNYSFARPVGGYNETIPVHLKEMGIWEQHNAAIVRLSASYQPGYKYVQYPDYKTGFSRKAIFSLSYDKGIPGILNSKSDFDKWRLSVSQDFRIRMLGNISYSIAAGGFVNTNYVAAPDLMHLYGNRGLGFASAYLKSFQFAQYYAFSNKDNLYGEAHIEYNLRGLITDRIPLLQQAHWYFVTGTNSFYGSHNDYYTEVFFGIDNFGFKALHVFRLDFVQSWDSYGGRNSGIRFGINTHGLIAAKLSEASAEW